MSIATWKKLPFERFKREFLEFYQSLKVTDFKHAAQALMNIKLPRKNITCEITASESFSKAGVETYLKSESIIKEKFNENSQIPVPPINQTESSTSSGKTCGSSTQTDETQTPLADLLQNFVLHLFAATQNLNKIYERVSEVGPETSSTGFMSETVKAQEAFS